MFPIPDEFMAGIMGRAKQKTIEDVSIGSHWKDQKDDSLWRVTHKDDKVHMVGTDSVVQVFGINMFFTTFSLVEFGAICISCKRKYEYAEKQMGFLCWSCKNGA